MMLFEEIRARPPGEAANLSRDEIGEPTKVKHDMHG